MWEKTPIFQRRDACLFFEGAAKVALIGKTQQKRHLAERLFCLRKNLPSLLDAPRTHKLTDADAEVLLKAGSEIGGVNTHFDRNLSERRYGEVLLLQAIPHATQPARNNAITAGFP